MTKGLVIHPLTGEQLKAFEAKPKHALILLGPSGSGKRSLAIDLANKILGVKDVTTYPYASFVTPEQGKAIGIEAVRELEHFLSLKVPSKADFNRFILFEDSHLLTHEAQNALLKTLEEPPTGSLIILTASSEQSLLPTIRSRAQIIRVNRPGGDDVGEYFTDKGYDKAQIAQAAAISGSLPGLMSSLLDDSDHQLTKATQYARDVLSKSTYERLILVDELAKQRDLALNVCFILQQMAHVSLHKATGKTAEKWQKILSTAYETATALNASAQPKLALTNLMLNL